MDIPVLKKLQEVIDEYKEKKGVIPVLQKPRIYSVICPRSAKFIARHGCTAAENSRNKTFMHSLNRRHTIGLRAPPVMLGAQNVLEKVKEELGVNRRYDQGFEIYDSYPVPDVGLAPVR